MDWLLFVFSWNTDVNCFRGMVVLEVKFNTLSTVFLVFTKLESQFPKQHFVRESKEKKILVLFEMTAQVSTHKLRM